MARQISSSEEPDQMAIPNNPDSRRFSSKVKVYSRDGSKIIMLPSSKSGSSPHQDDHNHHHHHQHHHSEDGYDQDDIKFIAGDNIDFEYSSLTGSEIPEDALDESSKKSKKKKKKKRSTALVPHRQSQNVQIHDDGNGVTINNVDLSSPHMLADVAAVAANTLGSVATSTDAVRSTKKKKKSQKDKIWDTSNEEERQRIKQFWVSLSEDDRRSLIKIEKETVLQKMKEQQRHSCSCSVCGRKRLAIEEELEFLYDTYYSELDVYADNSGFTQNLQFAGPSLPPLPPPPSDHNGSPEISLSAEYYSEYEEEEEDEEEEDGEYSEYGDDEEDYENSTPHDCYHQDDHQHANGHNHDKHGHQHHHHHHHEHHQHFQHQHHQHDHDHVHSHSAVQRHDVDRTANSDAPAFDLFNFGSSLSLNGGILTVADDLLKNDGKKFIDMMEQLAERRLARDEETLANGRSVRYYDPEYDNEEVMAKEGGYTEEQDDGDYGVEMYDDEYEESGIPGALRSDEDEYDDEYDQEEEEYGDEEDGITTEQRIAEGRRMLQIIAARMFEQRVLAAYRESVAQERQQKLLEELEEEERLKEEREQKKLKDKEKKKDKKRALKQAKDEERARKEAERLQLEAAARAEQEKKNEERRKRQMELKAKKDAEKKKKEEEEKKKKQEEERRREERKRKEREEQEARRLQKELEAQQREEERKQMEQQQKELEEQEKQWKLDEQNELPVKKEELRSQTVQQRSFQNESYESEQAQQVQKAHHAIEAERLRQLQKRELLHELQRRTVSSPSSTLPSPLTSSDSLSYPQQLPHQKSSTTNSQYSQNMLNGSNGYVPMHVAQQSIPLSPFGLPASIAQPPAQQKPLIQPQSAFPYSSSANSFRQSAFEMDDNPIDELNRIIGSSALIADDEEPDLPNSMGQRSASMISGYQATSSKTFATIQPLFGASPSIQSPSLASPNGAIPPNVGSASSSTSMWATNGQTGSSPLWGLAPTSPAVGASDQVRRSAIRAYNSLTLEGWATPDGYVSSPVLYQATMKLLGTETVMNQTEFHNACGVFDAMLPERFESRRDNVGIVTHLKYCPPPITHIPKERLWPIGLTGVL